MFFAGRNTGFLRGFPGQFAGGSGSRGIEVLYLSRSVVDEETYRDHDDSDGDRPVHDPDPAAVTPLPVTHRELLVQFV